MPTQAEQPRGNWEQCRYWEAVAGKAQRELPGREGYWLAGKQPAVPVGRGGLKTEGLGVDRQVGQVADTVGYKLAGMGRQEVADRD